MSATTEVMPNFGVDLIGHVTRISKGRLCAGGAVPGDRGRARWVTYLVVLVLFPVLSQSVALAADESLGLPALVAVDSDLAAAVIRVGNGDLTVIRRGDPIDSGRWRLDSVARTSVVLVSAADDDSEAGTRVRLYVGAANTAPLIVRREAPATPLAPRLVLQTGTMKSVATDSPDRSKDRP